MKRYIPRKKPGDKPPVYIKDGMLVIEIRDEVNDDWIKVLDNEKGATDLKAHAEIERALKNKKK